MKKLIFAILFFFLMVGQAGATYYCSKVNGTCTVGNKANAVVTTAADCTAQATAGNALPMSQVSSLSGMADGSIVYFSAKNLAGTDTPYTVKLTVPQGGSASGASRIWYQGIADGAGGTYPTLATADGATESILTNGKNHIVVDGFITAGVMSNNFSSGAKAAGADDDITYSHITIAMAGASGATRYVVISSGANTNSVYDHISSAGSTNFSYNIYGTGSGGNTFSNITNVGGSYGFSFAAQAGLALADITQSNATSDTQISLAATVTGTVSVARIHLSGGKTGMYFLNTSLTAGSSVIDSDVTSGTGVGTAGIYTNGAVNLDFLRNTVTTQGGVGFLDSASSYITHTDDTTTGSTGVGMWADYSAHHITYTRVIAQTGVGDGIGTGVNGVPHDVTYYHVKSLNNGDGTSAADGDGITSHNDAYNLSIKYSLFDGNACSGLGLAGTSQGIAANNTFVNNGFGASKPGGVTQVRGGIYLALTGTNTVNTGQTWIIKNNITKNNWPYELNLTSYYPTMDYNLYWSDSHTDIFTLDYGSHSLDWTGYHVTNSKESHSRYGDPLFVSTTNYHTRLGSPARGGADGSILSAANIYDYSGNVRITDATGALCVIPDIGAYQSQPQGFGMGM